MRAVMAQVRHRDPDQTEITRKYICFCGYLTNAAVKAKMLGGSGCSSSARLAAILRCQKTDG